MILANTKYLDQEIYYISETCCGTHTTVRHKRVCAACSGYLKEPKQYVLKEPEPVSAGDLKYNLIGIGYEKGVLRLIVEDWVTNKKFWADEVYDYNGDKITVKNMRFV
jgi:hypothetical protein